MKNISQMMEREDLGCRNNINDSADLDSYIHPWGTSLYDKIYLYRYHLHPESRMLWKKLVQFGKGF